MGIVAVSSALIVSTLSQIFEALDGAEVAAEAGDEQLERLNRVPFSAIESARIKRVRSCNDTLR
jgi:hypothetical protein